MLTSFWMDSEVDSNAETNSGTSSDMPRLEAPTLITKRWSDKYDSLPSPATWMLGVNTGNGDAEEPSRYKSPRLTLKFGKGSRAD